MKDSGAWMPLYIGDYLADTGHLTTAEHGAYLLLIMQYWRVGPLPNDDGDLARMAVTEPDDWSRIAPRIKAFFRVKGGRLTHKRIEVEKKRAENNSKKRAKSGRLGGVAKREKAALKQIDTSKCQEFATGLQGICHAPSPSPSPSPEEAKLASSVPELARENGKHPRNPTLNDPSEAWLPLADNKFEWVNGKAGPVKRAVVGGSYIEDAARLVTEAAGINGYTWRGDWRPLIAWLTDDLDLHDVILPAVRRVADRPGYAVPRSLAYFDAAVREGRGAA